MKWKLSTLLFVFLFFSSSILFGQYLGPGSNWYFGSLAGMTWCTLQPNGDPMYLMDGMVATQEGVATISDNSCNLLFYTDGITVWNANHQPMANSLSISPGGSLTGDPSSTQSGVIVPKPMDANTYYIFSVDAEAYSGGLAFSRVDMTANSGLGDIDLAQKNVTLFTPSTEKIAAVNHDNGTDIWVITHQWNNNQFNAYLVTSSGVQYTSPVITSIGIIHTGTSGNSRGYMKASPGGGMVALGIEGMNVWELLSFDNSTGQLSNVITLDYTNNDDCYGIEFSADEHYLYGSERFGYDLHQWDVSLATSTAIIASHQIVATLSSPSGGALQLAPDQKIYMARNNSKYLGRINEPTIGGNNCNYVDQAVLLGPDLATARTSKEGLPSFFQTFFTGGPYPITTSCYFDTVFLEVPNPQGLDSAWWNFNYPSSDTNFHYQGTESEVWFIYPAGGIYTVELITKHGNFFDTLYIDVYFSQLPVVNLGPDVTLCEGDSLVIDLSFNDQFALDGSCDYLWEADLGTQIFYDSSATYSINQPGVYTVEVYADSICGSTTDVISVSYNNVQIDLGPDITTGLCQGDPYPLDATYSNFTYGISYYTWNTGSNQPVLQVDTTGIYSVTVTNGLCSFTDSIYVEFGLPLTMPLGATINFCPGDTVMLDAMNPGATYSWSTGDSAQIISATTTGMYTVSITNACGYIVDNIILWQLDTPMVDLGSDISICEGIPQILSAYTPNCFYLWSTGDTLPEVFVLGAGTYSVTATNMCASVTDEIVVSADTFLTGFNLGNDTSVCSGFVLDCGYPDLEYLWSTGETTQSIMITQSDDYSVDITNLCGIFADIIHIDIIEMNVDLGDDTVLCPGSVITLDAQNPGSVYIWSNGAMTQTTEINQPGMVWLWVTNICETQGDTLFVSEYDLSLDIGNDTSLCEGDNLWLDAGHPTANVLWSTGDTTHNIEVDQTGNYAVTVSHFCGDLSDTIDVTINPSPLINFGGDTLDVSGPPPFTLNPQTTGISYLWSNGSTDSIATIYGWGMYSVTITNEYGCTTIDSVLVLSNGAITNVEKNEQLNIYPNPAQNKLFIETGGIKVEEIRVYNSLGSLISQIQNIEYPIEVNTQNLSEGIYFVKILAKDNEVAIKSFSVIR
ncbi:MAG: T9SS type A sorting domain-containing protein [Bacteroidales bacterium]|nr:T9SS type A sorting domain-containing protein [Bacteroidales bacterium]MCF8455516.1 T9SS type A sorting domain-containing protein [Bacteroidales bacterium]